MAHYSTYQVKSNTEEKYHLVFVGDLHGDTRTLSYIVGKCEHTVIVICGDIGIGFESKKCFMDSFHKADETCVFKDNYVFMIRGNHDDPKYFNEEQVEWERIRTVQDYSILDVEGVKCLCVGGAISVDRQYRLKQMNDKANFYKLKHLTSEQIAKKVKRTYWENEPPYFDEDVLSEMKNDGINIDVVCTHTCPSFCEPLTKDGISYWIKLDMKLEEDLKNERGVMDKLYDKLLKDEHPIKLWCYGHYHTHHNDIINGIEFVMLNALDMHFDMKEYNF